jgi:hypothetical protein
MRDANDASSISEPGYITPPLSPSKTISTVGWSPRTPGSPHKSRSCLLLPNLNHEIESPFFTPPPSPTKLKVAARLGTLVIPEVLSPTCDLSSPDSTDDSPEKRDSPSLNLSSHGRSLNVARAASRSLPTTTGDSDLSKPLAVPSNQSLRAIQDGGSRIKLRKRCRSSSDSSIDALVAKYATPPASPVDTGASTGRKATGPNDVPDHAMKINRRPTRASSSPLRPSQWTSRGGLLSSPRKSQTSTPDRFIHYRRPPGLTRETFELNKPNEREQILRGGLRAGGDPFSHRVRRSDRLNTELQGLREAHTVTARGAGGISQRLNPRLRSSSRVDAARQISAGAVWNVGGSSAVSDTVSAISTGNRSMLGSSTIAPLYTSVFLDRADPEAELEAYERRLALALEVDQIDRVLQHSASPIPQAGISHANMRSNGPHIWRDGAWNQDGLRLCSFLIHQP